MVSLTPRISHFEVSLRTRNNRYAALHIGSVGKL